MKNVKNAIMNRMHMLKNNKFYQSYNTPHKINTIEWLCLALVILSALLCFYYFDITATVDNSILLLKSILKGEFFNFYDFAIGKTKTVWAPNYEVPMYIIFAIWNIPLAVASKLFQIDYLFSFPAIMWTKLFLLICMLATTHLIGKICILMKSDKNQMRLAQFLFLSSINLLIPTLMISQCDILTVFFIMLGIYFYLKKQKWVFIFCFAIAIPLKMFAFFIFVPLILIDEKKIINAMWQTLCGLSILVAGKLLFSNNLAYEYMTGSVSNFAVRQLQESKLLLGSGTFVIFIACVVIVCIWCFMKDVDETQRSRLIIYIPFLIFSVMFATFAYLPYWIVLLAPFTALTIAQNLKYLKINILVETLGAFMGFICCTITFPWVYQASTLHVMLLSKIPFTSNENYRFGTIAELLTSLRLDRFTNAIFTVFVVCLLVLIVINFPLRKDSSNQNKYEIEHGVIFIRLMGLIAILVLWGTVYLAKADPLVLDTMNNQTSIVGDTSILKEGNQVKQKFNVNQDTHIKSIDLQFENEASNHINTSTITITVRKTNSKSVLFEKEIGTSLIDAKIQNVKMDIDLKKNVTYEICLTGKNDNGLKVMPLLTEDIVYDDFEVEINGNSKPQNLYFKMYCE